MTSTSGQPPSVLEHARKLVAAAVDVRDLTGDEPAARLWSRAVVGGEEHTLAACLRLTAHAAARPSPGPDEIARLVDTDDRTELAETLADHTAAATRDPDVRVTADLPAGPVAPWRLRHLDVPDVIVMPGVEPLAGHVMPAAMWLAGTRLSGDYRTAVGPMRDIANRIAPRGKGYGRRGSEVGLLLSWRRLLRGTLHRAGAALGDPGDVMVIAWATAQGHDMDFSGPARDLAAALEGSSPPRRSHMLRDEAAAAAVVLSAIVDAADDHGRLLAAAITGAARQMDRDSN
jgi:hypothetical protein